ncbi:hypothetical protein [Methylobacterium sp. yr668]|uniref:hypothetical protein n=1 Tax=Methylobacterium sp. yr668 TaxID=1761801 RepID=UPI0008F35FE9|nr:hypothetical protein [Methylobacterium sp. yr668]SFT30425.1 hypothetical protein SAMN04487845_1755 [Methylobacterium sp. yr668]
MSPGSIVSHFEGIAYGLAGAMAGRRSDRVQAVIAARREARTLDRVATVAEAMSRDRQEIGDLRAENALLRDELATMRARAVRAEAMAIRDSRQP